MQITKTLLFSHGTKITAHAVELAVTTTDAQPWPTEGTEWEVKSRWTTAEEAEDAARKLIADEADALRRDGLTAVVSEDGLAVAWVDDAIPHRRHAVRVRETTVRVPTGTPTTRLARLAIELSGLTPDPRSLAALEAAERGGATDDTFASAKAATEDARGRRAENVALAIEAAVGAQVFPGAETFATAAATRVMDAVRLRAHAERDAQVRALVGPWTEAHAETERARLRTLPAELVAALGRVREVLPGYEPDEDARRWIDRPEVRTYEVEGAGADQTVEGTSSEDAAHEAAAIQYGALGAVTVRFVDRGSDSATLGVYEVEVDGVPQARRLVVREASR